MRAGVPLGPAALRPHRDGYQHVRSSMRAVVFAAASAPVATPEAAGLPLSFVVWPIRLHALFAVPHARPPCISLRAPHHDNDGSACRCASHHRRPVCDGHTATRRIRKIEAERGAAPIPIVALSASCSDEEARASAAAVLSALALLPRARHPANPPRPLTGDACSTAAAAALASRTRCQAHPAAGPALLFCKDGSALGLGLAVFAHSGAPSLPPSPAPPSSPRRSAAARRPG